MPLRELPFADMFVAFLGAADATAASGIRVLDVGTGLARIPIPICLQRRDVTITAIDRSSTLLARAQILIEQAGLTGRIELQQAEADSLPFEDAEFDAVISNGLIHHLEYPVATLSEMQRVLKPGGILFIRDSLPRPDFGRIASLLGKSATTTPAGAACLRKLPAAWSLAEAQDLACRAGLPPGSVRKAGLRHWTIHSRQSAERKGIAPQMNTDSHR